MARALVVEDDPAIREVVLRALLEDGHDVLAAPDGRVALAFAADHATDVIVLDDRMPVMDGPSFAAAYRRAPGPHAPIVLVTAAHDLEDRAREVRADGALGKPFDLDELLALVTRYAG